MKAYIVFNTGDCELDKGADYGPWIDSTWFDKKNAKNRLKEVRKENGNKWASPYIEEIEIK